MIKLALAALLLMPGLAIAVICKSVDADGVVSYADVPAAECPEKVKLPDYSRYAPRPINQPANATGNPATGGESNPAAGEFVRYESISISQPKTGGVVRSNEGEVTVVIDLKPALQPGHRVGLTIDGRSVQGTFDSIAIDLSGVERGTHTLRATVADENGRILIANGPVIFTLRKTGLFDSNANNQPGPPPTPDPGFPAPTAPPDFDPPDGADFSPGDPADYSPGDPANFTPPASPGFSPNGAFSPKFTP